MARGLIPQTTVRMYVRRSSLPQFAVRRTRVALGAAGSAQRHSHDPEMILAVFEAPCYLPRFAANDYETRHAAGASNTNDN